MIIQIDGTGTENKGAELMLYSILEEIERKQPDAQVILNSFNTEMKYIKTSLNTKLPFRQKLIKGQYKREIINRLGLPYHFFTDLYPLKNVDVVFDAGGFRFGDKWHYSDKYLQLMEKYYKTLKANGTLIIYLPQAFGPFTQKSSKKCIDIINKYVDIVIAREEVSRDYLLNQNLKNPKLFLFPDFTFQTKGTITNKFERLNNSICIIPNRKMFTQTACTKNEYIHLLGSVITEIQEKNHEVFLLNHEGPKDRKICREINNKLQRKVQIVDNLNAKEIKGLIGQSKLVISSRFHGVASALSQNIPCIATSWSHKYEKLYNDFKLDPILLDMEDGIENINRKIADFVSLETNLKIREHLKTNNGNIKLLNKQMWKEIWSLINSELDYK